VQKKLLKIKKTKILVSYIVFRFLLIYHMVMEDFRLIGRREECLELERCLSLTKPQLILVYGRRRVGKTYLVDTYFDNKFTFKFTGVHKLSEDKQLLNFSNELAHCSKKKARPLADWTEAFFALRNYLDRFDDEEKKIVFIDELPWLDNGSGSFLKAFEYFWNQYANAKKNLVFIAAGSNTSYLLNKLIRGKGGFYKRVTSKIRVSPFTLLETEEFLNSVNIHWDRRDIVDCYMTLGGLPYYLQHLRPNLSPSANIDWLLFNEDGPLYGEFAELYETLFKHSAKYVAIMERICLTRYGLTSEDIAGFLGKKATDGSVSSKLKALCDCGFLKEYSSYLDGRKRTLYRCADYFTFFYLRFVRDHQGKDPHFWSSMIQTPARISYEGYAFEWICFDSNESIKKALGISGVLSDVYTWTNRNSDQGVQIDMVIDRHDRIVNLCEIKYTSKPYEISKEEWWGLSGKIEAFMAAQKARKTVFLTIVSAEGLKKTGYASRVNQVVTLDDLFSY